MRSFLQTSLRQETEENIDDSASSVSYENEKENIGDNMVQQLGLRHFFQTNFIYRRQWYWRKWNLGHLSIPIKFKIPLLYDIFIESLSSVDCSVESSI